MKFSKLLMAAATALLLTGVAQAQDKPKLKIVSVVTRLENDYFTDWNKGAKSAAEALGIDYSILSYDGQPAKQLEIIQSQLAAGAKGFFGDSNDTANVKAITSLVGKKGATYIAVWDTLPWMHPLDQGDGYGSYFAGADVKNAYDLAKILFNKMGGKGNVVHITGFPGASPDIARTIGFKQALKEFPNIKVVVEQPGNWNPVDSRKVMEDAIVANDQIDGVFAQNDSEGLGVVQALDESGLKIPVVGFDGNAANLDMIEQGRYLASVNYMPQYQAGLAMVRAYDILNGWKPSPVERMMATGATIVTKDNVATLKKFMNNDKLPFDWKKMSHVLHPTDWDPQNNVWPFDVAKLWEAYPKPSGYTLPKAYLDAVKAGDLDKYTKEYADHYKAKIPE